MSRLIDPADLRWLWLTQADQDHIGSLARVLESAPDLVLSAHLPAARDLTSQLLDCLAEVPAAAPFVGPGHEAFQAIVQGLRGPQT